MDGQKWLESVLDLGPDWRVTEVMPDAERKELRVRVERRSGAALRCPKCGRAGRRYDTRERKWRNLDAWGYRTFFVCGVPRVDCPEHGVSTLPVPWAEGRSRYTAAFEMEVAAWLREASVLAVAKRMRMSWNAVAGIMDRAVRRGLERRKAEPLRRLSVDETSFKRRHRYVTVVSDPDTGRVLHVAQGRSRASLESFYRRAGPDRLGHSASNEIMRNVRNLAVELFNKHGLLEVAQRLTKTLRQVFAEMEPITELLDKDVSALDRIAKRVIRQVAGGKGRASQTLASG